MTVPAISAPAFLTRILAVVIVVGSMLSLNVINTFELMATFVSPASGVFSVTVGRVMSGATLVVNVQTLLLASVFPAKSFAPVVAVAVYKVLAAKGAVGLKVAVLEPAA